MYIFISIMLCGAVIGYFVRDRKSVQKTGTVIQVVVCALLYMLGLSIGSNRFLIDHLSYFCGQAAFIAFMSLHRQSVGFLAGVSHIFQKGEELMKGSLLILVCFILGCLSGCYHEADLMFMPFRSSYCMC